MFIEPYTDVDQNIDFSSTFLGVALVESENWQWFYE